MCVRVNFWNKYKIIYNNTCEKNHKYILSKNIIRVIKKIRKSIKIKYFEITKESLAAINIYYGLVFNGITILQTKLDADGRSQFYINLFRLY